jgi:hypothetical protein
MHILASGAELQAVRFGYVFRWKLRTKGCSHNRLSVQRRARWIQNGVVCVEVDQRITSSKSNIIDVYREKGRPENLTLWHLQRRPEVRTAGPPM